MDRDDKVLAFWSWLIVALVILLGAGCQTLDACLAL